MKLACVRCKQKKIKCGKEAPTCQQCVTAACECVYVERRKRPRLAQHKNDVKELNRRLQFLEQQLQGSERSASASPTFREESVENTMETQPSGSVEAPVMRECGKESWIYRLASDTRQQFEKVNTQNHSTPSPMHTPGSLTVDDAISGLKEALDDLGKQRVRSDERVPRAPELVISTEEAKMCVKSFREMMSTMVIPDIFTFNPNTDILDLLPDLMSSPYVSIDPGLRVAYYNALYYGLLQIHGPGNPHSTAAYQKILEAVPAWLNSSTNETDLDGHGAALTSYTAVNNFDYQLSWKFHCRACHYLKSQGIDRLDSTPCRSNEEEDRRQSLRYLYWLVLQSDLLFRLFYGKPAMIRWKLGKVQPPTLFSASNMKPSAAQSTCYVVWIRYIVMTAEVFNVLDDSPERPRTADVLRQVDEYCSQLEELLADWNLMTLLKTSNSSTNLSWLYADLVIDIYASIVGIRRLARDPNDPLHVDEVTLRAAREIIRLILMFNGVTVTAEHSPVFFHFISFYPFCAIFTLYEHILACTNPNDCEEDVQSLEAVGSIINEHGKSRSDVNPLSKIINALNKVSRAMQESRRNSHQASLITAASRTPLIFSAVDQPQPQLQAQLQAQLQPQVQSSDQQPNLGSATGLTPPPPNPGQVYSDFSSLPDFNMNSTGEILPLDFIRTLENDFIGRNWHETWWNMDGGLDINSMDIDMGLTPASGSHDVGTEAGTEQGTQPGTQSGPYT